jgi:hypothetical protein
LFPDFRAFSAYWPIESPPLPQRGQQSVDRNNGAGKKLHRLQYLREKKRSWMRPDWEKAKRKMYQVEAFTSYGAGVAAVSAFFLFTVYLVWCIALLVRWLWRGSSK